MAIQRITVFEFAPTADEIWCIPRHDKDGYARYDADDGLVSILDTAHDTKLRPEIITNYAGGKATNVARVLDRLLMDKDDPYVELITFLPPPPDGPLRELEFGNAGGVFLRPSTAAGIYIQCLQIAGLRRVRPHFEVVDELAESGKMQTTRSCIEITLKEDSGSLNFSPRIVWSQRAADAVLSRVAEVTRDADLVVMAGSPPIWNVQPGAHLTSQNFYAGVMDAVGPDCHVSIDTRGRYLHDCLMSQNSPRFAFMNRDEFGDLAGSWSRLSERFFPGTLLVHDKQGCWVWDEKLPTYAESLSEAEFYPSMRVPKVYSTIGAGDAMHAGFLKEWICAKSEMSRGERVRRAAVYSQIVAGFAVSNERATHGINAQEIESEYGKILTEIWHDSH